MAAAAAIPLAAYVPARAQNVQSSQETQQLQQQLQAIQSQIDDLQQQLKTVQGQKNTLANKIKQLQNQQAALNLQIHQTNLQISDLDGRIEQAKSDISANEAVQRQLQEQIGGFLRLIQQRDQNPLLYSLMTESSWSRTLDDIETYKQISNSLQGVLEQARTVREQLAEQQAGYQIQQEDAQNLLAVKVLQQTELGGSISDQSVLLQQTKGKESDYQITLSDTQKRAAEIRNRIYQLLGVTSNITFGQAVQIAQDVSSMTGIEAAFLLAILTQESNLGQNVGTCNRPGDPPEKSWKVVMKPDRDQQPFLQITSELGMDPDVTPVSCPMKDSKGNQVGWGGAMGPAQFIPSTWIGYKDKVSQITGSSPANPWDIRDAFVAAAILLKANGADNTDQGEWNAAMRYFSGSTNTKYRFYGDNVLAQTQKYRDDIGDLNK